MDILQDALNLMIAPDPANLQSVKFTINGTFTPSSPVDGWNSVEVDVPDPVLTSINITENDTYTPPSGVDGYNSITVNVPTSAPAVIESLSITENGTYTAETGVDGYSPITVNVPSDTSIGYIGLYCLKEEEQHIGTALIIAETGSCGDNATYVLYQNGTLEISGTGEIARSAFMDRQDVENVVINNGITSTDYSVFSGCTSLTAITIPDSVTSIGSAAFSRCTALTNITIPDSVTDMGDDTFNYCTALTNITISNNVTSIGSNTFSNCTALTKITIPDSVTSIGIEAFSDCTALAQITILAITPPTAEMDMFYHCDKLRRIYVPASSVNTYKAASDWSMYASMIRAIPDNS